MTPEQQKFVDIKNTTGYKEIGDDLDYKVYVDDEKKEVVLLFKETDCDRDWINNVSILPWPLRLDDKIVWTTHGYARIYASGENLPLTEFLIEATRRPEYKMCIRGFSLGSAMAKIAARHFIIRTEKQIPIDELTTYGDVKCWLNPFYSAKKHCKRIREYVTSNDFVTWCVPFYRRDVKCKVGPRFSFCRLLKTAYNHEHYEEYDYTKYEGDDK
jgi:hypothetical protein